jgi:hypothetical protein
MTTIKPKNGNALLRMHAPLETHGILLPDMAQAARVGIVIATSEGSKLPMHGFVIASMYGRHNVDGFCLINEDAVFAIHSLAKGHPVAFPGRLVVLLDKEPDNVLALPQITRNKMLKDGSMPKRLGTVLSSGFEDYREGERIVVDAQCIDALDIVPHDIDLPYDVPAGQVIRCYSGKDIHKWVCGIVK